MRPVRTHRYPSPLPSCVFKHLRLILGVASGKQRLYGYVIGNIGVTGAAQRCSRLDGEDGGGEIHGPEHHPGGGVVDTAGVDDAENLGTVQGEVAPVHGHAKSRDTVEATGAGHVVEACLGVEVMAAAGASADGGTATTVAVGEGVATETDDEARVHRDLRRCSVQGKFKREGTGGKKSGATLRK